MSTPWTITFDCADPAALAAFWKLALGYVDAPPPSGFDSWDAWFEACDVPVEERHDGASLVDPDGSRPSISFLRVPEGKTAKNRLHLDVRAAPGLDGEARMAALEAESERLVGLGATKVRTVVETQPMPAGFVVMQDPEGNEFCLD